MILENDPITVENAQHWWFGCWLQPGHFLRGGSAVTQCPFYRDDSQLDGGYAPRKLRHTGDIVYTYQGSSREIRHRIEKHGDELPQGSFLRHFLRGVTFISWWDRTQGDTRGNCNSTYLVLGNHPTRVMLEWFPRHFPLQAERMTLASVHLVEWSVSPTFFPPQRIS